MGSPTFPIDLVKAITSLPVQPDFCPARVRSLQSTSNLLPKTAPKSERQKKGASSRSAMQRREDSKACSELGRSQNHEALNDSKWRQNPKAYDGFSDFGFGQAPQSLCAQLSETAPETATELLVVSIVFYGSTGLQCSQGCMLNTLPQNPCSRCWRTFGQRRPFYGGSGMPCRCFFVHIPSYTMAPSFVRETRCWRCFLGPLRSFHVVASISFGDAGGAAPGSRSSRSSPR